MTRFLATVSAISLTASAASAGGVDRSGQPIGVIFEDGTYAEFSLGYATPNVSGVENGLTGEESSGNMADQYFTLGAAVKHEYSNGLEVALIWDHPYGANVNYPTGTGYYAAGATAELKSNAITGVVKYGLDENISIYSGVRYQTLEATAALPFVGAGYEVTGERDDGIGYLVGVSYEIPEIALRVALTYNSAISHELDTTETGVAPGPVPSVTEVDTPQSVNLDFQSGIAPDTLLFGSVRWADWTEFEISPLVYSSGAGPLVSYRDDRISYTLGVGRRLNESWSAAVSAGYEAQAGGLSSNLGPTDGYWNLGLGATYTQDNMKITAGARYVDIGDAQTSGNGVDTFANWEDNKALGFGMKVGFSF